MPHGYWGTALFVDLSSAQIEVSDLSSELYRQYLGGYGLGARILYEQIPAGADPLGPDNVLAFLPGLLTGSRAPLSGRFMVAAKSPLTGGWGDANCGGRFGPALRGAGYDAVFVRGISPHPVYLHIDENGAELRDAAELWGLDTLATEKALRQSVSPNLHVACIGPAGERASLIAGIVNDGGRIAGRCGLGAVMGAKRLKAVAASGRRSPSLQDKATFDAEAQGYRELFRGKPARWLPTMQRLLHALAPLLGRIQFQPTGGPARVVIDSFRRYGTAAGTALLVAMDDTPIRNWKGTSTSHFPTAWATRLSDEAVIAHNIKPYACHSCPVGCGAIIELPDGGTGHRPEYETLAVFGPTVMNADLDTVIRCNEICNLEGLDSISTGVAVTFAMECYEQGWLPAELRDELSLKWGDADAIVELAKRIASRQPGLGEWLADGVRLAARTLGLEAQDCAAHAGGQELPMHRSLYQPAVGVGYLVDPAPGRHTATNAGTLRAPALAEYLKLAGHQPARRYDYRSQGAEAAVIMPVLRAFDSLGLCMFSLSFGNPPFLKWLRAATGWDMDEIEFQQVGRRIQILRHAFNARHGVRPEHVSLPGRERGEPPLPTGPLAGHTLDTDAMEEGYYSTLGVDRHTGLPLPDVARGLGLTTLLEPDPS